MMACRCYCRRQVKLQDGRQCRLQKGAALTALGNPLLWPSDTALTFWTSRPRLGPPGHISPSHVLDHQTTFHQVTSWTTRPRLGPPGHVLDHQTMFWTTKSRSGPPGHVLDHQITFWTTRTRLGPQGCVLDHKAAFWTTKPRLGPQGCVLDHRAMFWTTAPRLGRPCRPLCSPQSKNRNER